jgi:HSP20 family protein
LRQRGPTFGNQPDKEVIRMSKNGISASRLAPWNWFRHEHDDDAGRKQVAYGNAEHPIVRLHQQMDRLFDDAFRSFGMAGPLSDWDPFAVDKALWPDPAIGLRPKVDIRENEECYQISVEVPGVSEEDLSLQLAGDCLIISGEKRQENIAKGDDKVHRIERSYGSFRRLLTLPADARPEAITAQFKGGVLSIKLPRDKSLADAPKAIAIERA